MRRFLGFRPSPPAQYIEQNVTMASAEKPDYEGIVFSDGTVVMRWCTDYRSHSIWSCWEDMYQVHGHPEYGTRIVWLDEE